MSIDSSKIRLLARGERELLDGAGLSGVTGVLAVEHVPSGKRLICGSRDLSKRLWDEQRALRRRRHHNRHLQDLLVLDGPQAFRVVLLNTLHTAFRLADAKKYHIDRLRKRGLALNVNGSIATSSYCPAEFWS